ERYQSATLLYADLLQLNFGSELKVVNATTNEGEQRSALAIPLFGRGEELSKLKSLWTAAKSGRGQMIKIEGEPGCGKSRLANEVIGYTENEGAIALVSKCTSDNLAPFSAFRKAITGLLASDSLGISAEQIRSAAAGWETMLLDV